jgi:WD40 repeat protein
MLLSGADGTLTVWHPTGPSTIARVIPGSPPAGGIYSPDGSVFATPANDDTVTFYATGDLHATATLTISGPGERSMIGGATPVAFSPDGHTVAIGDRLGDVQLFDARSYRPLGPRQAVDPPYSLVELVFSPDGRHLVTTSNTVHDHSAHVLTVTTGEVRSLEPPIPSTLTATFSPDGRQLVVPSTAGGATVFPVTSDGIGPGHVLERVGAPAESAAFSPDGRMLAVGRQNGTIQLLDARTLRPLGAPVVVTLGLIVFVAFSPDSRLLVAQTIDATNRLFDVARRAPIGDAFPGSGVGFGIASFSPHSDTVVLPGPSGTTLWDLDDAHWRDHACTLAGRNLTRAEWSRYLSSVGAYRPTCAA